MTQSQISSSSPVHIGGVLAGKYRIDKLLGEGGMGVVVAATHLQLNQRVALKFLLPSACNVPEAVERFLREARAAVQIRSEHVARVIDVGTLETGAPYMVMEYLAGHDLANEVEKHGPMPIERASEFLLQAIEAVAEAHALGIVHRDLKPANLFLTSRADGSPLVKVLDFGISKVIDELGSSNLTATSTAMGSPMYMSPEQVRSTKGVDVRTDVWALGVILYELVTGRVPFDAPTVSGILAQIIADPPTPIRDVRPDVPTAFADAIDGCLQKNREQRIPNVGELAKRLAPFCEEGSASAGRTSKVLRGAGFKVNSLVPGAEMPQVSKTTSEWSKSTGKNVKKSSAPWIVAALLGGSIVVGGIAYQLTRDGAAAAPIGTEPASDVPPPAPAAQPIPVAPIPTAPTPAAPPTSVAPAPAPASGITPITAQEHERLMQPAAATPTPPAPAPSPVVHKLPPRPKHASTPAPAPAPAVVAAPEPAAPKPRPKPKYNPLLDGR